MGRTLDPPGITFAEEPRDDGAPPAVGDSERKRLLGALGPSPVDIDELIRVAGVEARKAHIVHLELDLAGRSSFRSDAMYSAASWGVISRLSSDEPSLSGGGPPELAMPTCLMTRRSSSSLASSSVQFEGCYRPASRV